MSTLLAMQRDITEVKQDVKHVLDKVDDIARAVDSFETWKNGDGGENPGVNVRLDRAERFISVLLWAGGIVGGTLLTSLTVSILMLLRMAARSP